MSYRIIIEETFATLQNSGKEWKVVDTIEEVRAKEFFEVDSKSTVRVKEVFGYTPEIVKEATTTEEVYRQTVEDMNLKEVIAVINGIS